MLHRSYIIVYTTYNALCIVIMYSFAIFTVEFRPPSAPSATPFTMDCFVARAYAEEPDGSRACSTWEFENACIDVLERINVGTCGNTPSYAAIGEQFGSYAEQIDLYVLLTTVIMLSNLGLLWIFYTIRHYADFLLSLMRLLFLAAGIPSVYLLHVVLRATNQLDTGANTYAGQRVVWGWGFFIIYAYVLGCLMIHNTISLYVT